MAIYKSKRPTKDGRQYFFRIKYKDIYGKTHDYSSRKYKTSKEAVNEEAKYRLRIGENKTNTSNITLEKAFNEYIFEKAKKVKKQTIKRNYSHFNYLRSIKDKKINDIDLNIYKKFCNYLWEEELSVDYKNKIINLFKNILIYSNRYYNTTEKLIKFIVPFKEVNKLKKEMDFFTYEEYLKFDSVIDVFEYHTFFEMLYFLGLRQGECTALNWNDIDFKNKKVKINKTLTTKIKGENWTISTPKTKNSTRTLPLTEKLSKDLKIMYESAKQYTDFTSDWFVFGNSRPFAETTIQKRKNDYCKKADVKQIRIHDFRHSCASLLINKGASVSLVSKYLGHSNSAITLSVYTHMFNDELKNMTDILDAL